MSALPEFITITQLAQRTGVAPSALRYYEDIGLISAHRTSVNRRRYPRSVVRRVAVIQVAKSLGIPLRRIDASLRALPKGRDPTPEDWEAVSARWRDELTARIDTLARLRDQLSSCIGCGCLSLDRCALFNQADAAAQRGAGARYLLGDMPKQSKPARR